MKEKGIVHNRIVESELKRKSAENQSGRGRGGGEKRGVQIRGGGGG